jgi:mannose-6-phosphate isomerase-like protein (cupin superfamily)
VIPPYAIPDVYVLDLERVDGCLILLRDHDHLLRRFGQLEYRMLNEGEETPIALRSVADEIWSVITGEATLTMVDKRDGSPSENKKVQLSLSGKQPQAVLIPFGVAHYFSASKSTRLIRLATHADGTHPEDRALAADDLESNY